MAEPTNPVEIESRIRDVVSYISKGTKVVRQARDEYLAAKRKYQLALAVARQSEQGTRADREDKALAANAQLWEDMDTAEVTMKYAQDKKSDLESELSGLQTSARLIMQEYNVSGR
ncbi:MULTISPECIES: hypothetical protein [Mycobacteroides]|uniref:hypothetical protein n=1 Tax=Mycobacteroides TaxID=670516 RepID=UPI000926AB4A|nr:hypothetical protein [Mycobacteroides abscessus]NGX06416.1 hypothetical protein [Mycobacteroides franklinii]SHT24635.1 Uncharacterised protein [Mycobacteroides abscessus subsp. abscessus]SHW68508.1 Uncharacterised protein [Mycobacteroides abscessus subsp. abscessus]SHY70159.1 Uncharacterised protein [Mycobacteroides abscessus subsp. abscessus]SHZ45102.1 Uncharacterised protein [Mycobacteroides abscessus subsp. abscessus]